MKLIYATFVAMLLAAMAGRAGELQSPEREDKLNEQVVIPYDLLPERYMNEEPDVMEIRSRLAVTVTPPVRRSPGSAQVAAEPIRITTTGYGQLETMLRDAGSAEADSIVLTGPLDVADLKALYTWVMDRDGVDVINLEESILKNNEFPQYSFYDPSQFDNSRWFPVRRMILPEGIEKIGKAAFAYMRVEEINIPSTVREIGPSAFAYDRWLNCEIIIPEGVTTIESQTFIDCYRMESAPELPKSLLRIGDYAFANNRWDIIDLPDALHSIGEGAFYGCWLKSMVIPETCISIGDVAFQGCQELSEISLPQHLETIPYGMCGNCFSLKSIELPNNCRTVGMNAFFYAPLENVVFGSMVETIEKDAFLGCRLTTISLPASLRTLGAACFQDNNLMDVYCMAKVPPICEKAEVDGGNPFCGSSQHNNAILNVPKGTRRAYMNAYGWDSFSVVKEINSEGPGTSATNYFGVEGVNWMVAKKAGVGSSDTADILDISMKSTHNVGGRDCMMIGIQGEEEYVPVGEIVTEGEKVYFYDGMQEEWLLMYDFSLQPGDGCIIYGTNGLMLTNHSDHPRYMVECLSIEDIPDTELEMMTLNIWPYDINGGLEDVTYEVQWIRGLGSTVCPYDNDTPFLNVDDYYVREITLNGEILYSNYAAGVLTPSVSEEDSVIYDILGRRVTVPVAGNIYIRDGKKILWK